MRYLNRKHTNRWLWLFTCVLVVVGSILPGDSRIVQAMALRDGIDSVLHFVGYTALGYLPVPYEEARFATTGLICALAIGAALETTQIFVPGRTFEAFDMVCNVGGTLCGFVIGWRNRTAAQM